MFFRDIYRIYGRVIKNFCSKWVKMGIKIVNLREQLTFLFRCKKSNIFPSHIENKFRDKDFSRDYNKRISYDLRKNIFFFKNKLLNLEIRDLNFEIFRLNNCLLDLEKFLYYKLESYDFKEFFHDQKRYFDRIKYKYRSKLKRKFEYLKIKKHSQMNQANNVNENWFRNLTDKVIPKEVVNIMSRGSKFGISYSNKSLPIKNIIAEVESNIGSFSLEFKNECRSSLVKVINNFKRENRFDNFLNSNLWHELKIAKIFLRENPNLIFQKADKGNITVVSDKRDYINKINVILNDDTTYVKIRNPHINKLQNKLKDLLKYWKTKSFINDSMFKYLKCENGTVAKCYGLPKIHKEQLTYRIIISSINFPTNKLAKFLSNILFNVVGKTNSYIKDSWSFYDIMKDISIPNDHKMVSLDVVSLFTNIPLELVNDIIHDKWSDIKVHTKLTEDEFIKALDLVFNNTIFSFDNIFYEQRYGCPMGSPLSPVIANLVMEKLESIALSKLVFQPIIFKRYVDDIFTIVPEYYVDELMGVFNSIHDRIKFTKEIESNNQLSFLDIRVIKVNDIVKLDWYRKPTWSGRYLNFNSHHQFGNKICAIKGVIDRAIKLSHRDFRKKNLKLVKETFMNNSYPEDFIDKMIDERVWEVYNSLQKRGVNQINNMNRNNVYFSLPYVRGLSERIRSEFRKHNIQVFFRNDNNLGKLFNNCKDRDDKCLKSGVVYKINCKDCNSCYIGQTGRYLKKRLYEHQYSLRSDNFTSGLKEHCLNFLHSFDFVNVDILEEGVGNKFKRESLESIHILRSRNNVNLMIESSKLNSIYHPLLL